jgi:hypothetical protein
MATIYDKSNPYSEWLRTGLVESLVLLAVYGNRSPQVASTQAFANNIVKNTFTTANKWESWASIKDATPLLAEAAPNAFMEAIEQVILKNPQMFQELMKNDQGIFGECRHCGLLWALEELSWNPEYFTRAISILSELANIDMGGGWSNRAINSIKNIFLPHFPQTYANAEQRLDILDTLINKFPKKVWEFAQSYYNGGSFSESYRFRWRDTGGVRRGLEPEDRINDKKYLTKFFPKLVNLAVLKENLLTSTDEFTRLPDNVRDEIIKVLKKTNPNTFSKEDRLKILEHIREALNWINTYGDKERRKQISDLNKILNNFTPSDVIDRLGWLVSTPWPRLPQGESKEYVEKDNTIKEAQQKAAREILNKASVDNIIKFANTIQYPGILGYSLAKAVRDKKEDNEMTDFALSCLSDAPILIFIKGYANGRVETAGPKWIDKQIKRIKEKGNYSSEGCAMLYFGLPENSSTWSDVANHGKDVENAYWKQATGHDNNKEGALIAVEKLLDVKRPEVALKIAGNPHVSIPSALLQRLLKEILSVEDKKLQAGTMEEYYLGYVFNQLYENNDLSLEEMVRIEWPFAVIFKDIKQYTSSPTAIHRALQKDPHFFAQLITFIYKGENDLPISTTSNPDKNNAKNRAIVAREVLDSWYLMPGSKGDGGFDEKELGGWIEEARKKCLETGHITGCDIQIGFMLACTPIDPTDGAWPHVAIRNIVELLNNDVIDQHIQNEIYNSRGVTSRGLNDGGKQERELTEKYKKMIDIVKIKWPRTTMLLRSIAESYEYEAKREDVDSDLRDLRWD